MSIGGIGGPSGFQPAQIAAQYQKNAESTIKGHGKTGQALAEPVVEKSGVPGAPGHPQEIKAAEGRSSIASQKPDTGGTPSPNAVADYPRDTSKDGKISPQKALAYAAEKYRSESIRDNKPAVPNGINGQEPPRSSISLKI